ncbi:MAG: UbiH/UbiF/VisC/COQ6 family ubiquinone biosynthesis hydroxylase [Mariprofundaceae bacterium]|nr:UbiH/UbiF/VisC/COQ6 family ubiquinone biosynthesis hydroxylase [Mariprofundaceae bacterium]
MAGKQTQQRSYDMVIAGGGLVGVALALAVSKTGLNIAVIEAHAVDTFPDSKPERVIALSHASHSYLQQLGVWHDIVDSGVAAIRKVHICEPDNRGEVGMYQGEADIEALGYVVSNACILQALYKALPDSVDVLAPAQLQTLNETSESMQVHICQNNVESVLSCRLLVAADGTMSRVRRLRGIGSRGWDHNRFGLVASVQPNRPHRNVAHECFRSDGPLAFLPLDEERYSLVWTLTPRDASRIVAMDDADFLRELETAAGKRMQAHLGGFSAVGPRALFPFEYRVCEKFTATRTALIGNAAHTMHPVAGQGLNIGLRDVAVLSDILCRAIESGRDIAAPVVLEEYAQRRCADTLSVSAFTEGLNALFCTDLLPLKLARGAGMAAMNQLSPLRRWLMRRATGIAQQTSLGETA